MTSSADSERLQRRRQALEVRARVLRAVRAYFEREGFLEVETPARVRAPGQEVHLEAIAAEGRWLITSPEYHCKRLVAAGYERIVTFARCFRRGERGPHHQPEFTMIEWYRAGAPLEAIANDCLALLGVAAAAAGVTAPVPVPASRARDTGECIDLTAEAERVTVRALLARHAGLIVRGDETAPQLRAAIESAGLRAAAAERWDDLFFQVFLDHVEPHLGRGRPTVVYDWPTPLAALARCKSDDPLTAERFELYAGGLELANAFGELTDAHEQRRRFVAESVERQALGRDVYPLDEALLTALAQMPPTSGVALGFDRLLMLTLGAGDIREVVAFADDEV